jgi:hypothetical protein
MIDSEEEPLVQIAQALADTLRSRERWRSAEGDT